MTTEVLVPPLGTTVDTVTLAAWYAREGEPVTQGKMLFAIETDKATLDVEAPASGILRHITAQPGDEVKVLSAIASIAEPGDVERGAKGEERMSESANQRSGELIQNSKLKTQNSKRLFISPRARRLAEETGVAITALAGTGPEGAIVERDVRAYLAAQAAPAITPVARRVAEAAGVDWRGLAGSGPGGRITRDDVDRALGAPSEPLEAPAMPAAGPDEVLETLPLRSVRAVIAERMLRSQATAAQVTLTAEADATALVHLRRDLAGDGVAVSYNDLFLYILGRALREHPRLNVSLDGDTIKVWRRIDVALAVDTERGLLAPVVRDVGSQGLAQLAATTRTLIERAETGQCTPEELSGSTFTLTNLGMFGIDAFTPIINLPECAILGVGRIKTQPTMQGDRVVGREMVWLSLTFDHRLVDGGPAARFLQRVVQLVERPHLLMA